ncbi:c-type cytochrome [Roseateles sp.]|uniref:c-type cytochrome n=1 Tax=Roseateles sp. TaxID=1971397 RepID=UPI00286CCB31|nr:c-type cytochrome [Roseateles sp.]
MKFASIVSIALSALTALAAITATPAAYASPELAQKKNCMACHAVDKKIVGPAYKDVAAKYAKDFAKDKDAAVAKLADKIIKGGAGVWGPVPMPANAQVSPADAKTLAAWVLMAK